VAVTPAAHSLSSESDPSETGNIAPTDIGSVPSSSPDRPSDSSSSLGPRELYPKYANLPIATLKEHWMQGMIDLVGLHDWQVIAVMNMAAGKPPGLVPSNVRILTDDTGSADSLFKKYKRYSIPMLHPYYVAGLLLPKDFPETTRGSHLSDPKRDGALRSSCSPLSPSSLPNSHRSAGSRIT
jgi:hypothetical protein